jgi:hypothetical protein
LLLLLLLLLQNSRSDLGETPLFDYKMVDSDWLLIPAVAEYLLRTPQVTVERGAVTRVYD